MILLLGLKTTTFFLSISHMSLIFHIVIKKITSTAEELQIFLTTKIDKVKRVHCVFNMVSVNNKN